MFWEHTIGQGLFFYPQATLRPRHYYYHVHFTNEETESQRYEITTQSHMVNQWQRQNLNLHPVFVLKDHFPRGSGFLHFVHCKFPDTEN